MAAITSTGVGSGLDVQGIVKKLMDAESATLTKFTTREAQITERVSALGLVKSSVASLQAAVAGLGNLSTFTGVKSTSSSTETMTAKATNDAEVGNYNIDILQLAMGQRVTSKAGQFTGATQVLANTSALTGGQATLKVTFGSLDSPVTTFTADPARTAANITIKAKDGASTITLADVRDAINAAKVGVGATIVNENTGSARLVINGGDSGAKNAFKLEVVGAGASDLSKLAYNPVGTDANFEVLNGETAKDAVFRVNGVQINRSQNTVSDAISGVTLDLWKNTLIDPNDSNPFDIGSSKSIRLEVKRDSAGASTAVEGFVKAFNDFNKQVVDLTKFDPVKGKGATLQGDSATTSALAQVRSFFTSSYDVKGDITSISALGVAFAKDGSLTFNKTKFDAAVKKDPDAVAKFFGAYDKAVAPTSENRAGFALKVDSMLAQMQGSGGALSAKISGLQATTATIQQQRKGESSRLEGVQARYLKQFGALDLAIAKMQSTSSYLSTQLANLPKS
jgi:flagellar hook-associated protein 2